MLQAKKQTFVSSMRSLVAHLPTMVFIAMMTAPAAMTAPPSATRSPSGAYYSRPENYGPPTAIRRRSPTQNHVKVLDPSVRPVAFRPDSFNGKSPFATFNGRDSSDFLGPGSLGQALPASSLRHFTPPTAEYLRSGPNPVSNRIDEEYNPKSRTFDDGRFSRSLFFNDFDHGALILRYQDERARQGLAPLRLGSIRPGFAFFRHDY